MKNSYRVVVLNDGDDLTIAVNLPISVSDPTHQYPQIFRSYRVIGMINGTFELVPLCKADLVTRSLEEK